MITNKVVDDLATATAILIDRLTEAHQNEIDWDLHAQDDLCPSCEGLAFAKQKLTEYYALEHKEGNEDDSQHDTDEHQPSENSSEAHVKSASEEWRWRCYYDGVPGDGQAAPSPVSRSRATRVAGL